MVITYLAIRLTTGDYYWGSTSQCKPEFRAPWANTMSNKDVWKHSQEYYEKWISLGNPGSARYANIIGIDRIIIRKMIEKFQSGWIPKDDYLWLDYFNL